MYNQVTDKKREVAVQRHNQQMAVLYFYSRNDSNSQWSQLKLVQLSELHVYFSSSVCWQCIVNSVKCLVWWKIVPLKQFHQHLCYVNGVWGVMYFT